MSNDKKSGNISGQTGKDFIQYSIGSNLTNTTFTYRELFNILMFFVYLKLISKQQTFSFFTVWNQGKYIIAFACGGCFLGGLMGLKILAIIGAAIGGIYGLFYRDNQTASGIIFYNYKGNSQNDIWTRGEQMLALASGGAFLGGLIGQMPGAIIGCGVGIFFSFI